MKHIAITACALLLAAAPLHAQGKLGHIDRQALMLALPERKTAETTMQDFAKKLDDKLKAMATEYQTKVTEVQSSFATMTQTQKDAAQREIGEMEERITKAQETAKEDLAKQEQELMAPMLDRTDKAIRDVAAENNFTYIFDTSTGMVLYWEKGEDIMPLVKKKLNIP
ncbi:MAG: OmpH family outer membrane protein [Flavobacteriales bacterium]